MVVGHGSLGCSSVDREDNFKDEPEFGSAASCSFTSDGSVTGFISYTRQPVCFMEYIRIVRSSTRPRCGSALQNIKRTRNVGAPPRCKSAYTGIVELKC